MPEAAEPTGTEVPGEVAADPEPVPGVPSGGDLDWGSVVRELQARKPAIAAVYEEAKMQSFGDGVLRLVFPEDLSIYAKLAGDSRRIASLHEILEERLGSRPRLELVVAGEGGAVSAAPVVSAPAPPARERAPEPAREPARAPRSAPEPPEPDDAPMPEPPPVENPPPDLPEPPPRVDARSGGSPGPVGSAGRADAVPGADPRGGEIQDGAEVFEIAREFFGLGGRDGAG
ncbi:hypothetical protein GBA65_15365 [Rubrobacter marinus]|uniref:DNA polymerase III subunit tau-like C-terminal domain-containing protein n=1 Tax=Rubrobacter marinus TaxID=2653852 RepID=A0A6G8PZM7_9ACTN|nr:hypothetical protein [Rubrobacter marinus]QIN79679.1 hypothetical protein GBA65_15365 [Rubrobacter marinus]